MRLSDFQFDLPEDRIAQRPPPAREDARMMVVDRAGEGISDARIAGLPDYLEPGDLLVANDSRVVPARATGMLETGGTVEALFVRPAGKGEWIILVRPSRKVKPGTSIRFDSMGLRCVALRPADEGEWSFAVEGELPVEEALERHGAVPLPPYIRREPDETDRERYQTVYAEERGSVAAPTAGLHFTDELIARLEEKGVGFARVTLHVGPGTFRPVRTERVEDHAIEAERYRIPEETARAIESTKQSGGRVVAVGTTAVRTLEGAGRGGVTPRGSGWTDLFLYPPYETEVIDGMLTNFHLPGSSLFLLVCAVAGTDRMKAAYRDAVDRGYRFYSYGDCMLIL